MAQQIITVEDLQQFRLQLLEDLKALVQQPNPPPKEWLKSSDVRKMLGISRGTLQNLRIKGVLPYHTGVQNKYAKEIPARRPDQSVERVVG